ncbi:hypothetical protein MRX96_016823 [Rhipicephalus microplus]
MPLEDMVFSEDMSRQEDEASGWIVAHSRKKRGQDSASSDSPGPNASTSATRPVHPKVPIHKLMARQLPEHDTPRMQQREHENATLRSELQQIKASVEELRQRDWMTDVAVNVQQAEAQPRGDKRKAADPPVDCEKEFSYFKQEITGVVRKIEDAIAVLSSVIQTLSAKSTHNYSFALFVQETNFYAPLFLVGNSGYL